MSTKSLEIKATRRKMGRQIGAIGEQQSVAQRSSSISYVGKASTNGGVSTDYRAGVDKAGGVVFSSYNSNAVVGTPGTASTGSGTSFVSKGCGASTSLKGSFGMPSYTGSGNSGGVGVRSYISQRPADLI